VTTKKADVFASALILYQIVTEKKEAVQAFIAWVEGD
jgi:hypothetical protein